MTHKSTPNPINIKTKIAALAVTTVAVGVLSAQAIAASNSVNITQSNDQRNKNFDSEKLSLLTFNRLKEFSSLCPHSHQPLI